MIPNSFFDLMLSGEINIKPMTNESNTYFLDRDEGDIQIPEDIRHCVRKEMEFYRSNDHFKLDDTTTIIDQLNSLKDKLDKTEQELALTKEEEYSTFKKIISHWIDTIKLTNFELLYSASETNKFNAQAFHSACDGEGPTITVIETTNGCVFGGYNSQPWNNHYFSLSYGDNKCFIFTLVKCVLEYKKKFTVICLLPLVGKTRQSMD
ncbi:hypothetical protein CYY_010142 [Polysphondylium violaceum]|uniref:TLDc domain-containing protein n=1 Tax=Polysphondylium violaceum TaxID=133409 RepID=A0A8J4PJH4_9MYCE|nr:hypothetical protein CYY_010142 [Polysphondylium violaceum]